MDFQALKNKIIESKNKAIDFSAEKLGNSIFTVKNIDELNNIIQKSKETSFTNQETGITKEYIKNSYVLFGDENTDFFKEALVLFPVLAAKAFSQNITLKLAKTNMKDLNLKNYQVVEVPSLVIFEKEKVKKVISGRENILKLVKSFNLDINKQVENI